MSLRTDLEHLEAIQKWRTVQTTQCDCQFWGPSAFDTSGQHKATEVMLEASEKTLYMACRSSSYSSAASHLSVQMGAGLGCKYLGVTVSGRYDKAVTDNQQVCFQFEQYA